VGRPQKLLIAWAGLSLLVAQGCQQTRSPGSDVLLISVDTLRPDHLSLYGYARATSPELERWLSRASIFENAYSTEANTPPSVISILSGQLPQEHGVRAFQQLLPRKVLLLPDLLPAAYQTAAVVSNTVLTDESLGIADRFDHYDDFVDEPESIRPVWERRASRTTDAALRWLGESRDPDRPLFLWVHYIDPHGPYHPPADKPRAFRHRGEIPLERGRMHPFQIDPGIGDALHYQDRYDEEIAYTDAQIGRLLEGYSAQASLDDALVIFVADHGESMIEHERWFTHGYHVYEEIVRVPLVLRGPGLPPGRVATAASTIDIAPTVLRFAGAALPEYLAGVDLRDPEQRGRARPLFFEATLERYQWRAVLGSGAKWLLQTQQGSTKPRALLFYDLRRDPHERQPGPWPSEREEGRALLALSRRDPYLSQGNVTRTTGRMPTGPKIDPRADPEALERLRAMGYVE
jgi:arylsulfatase A-like enzyme